MSDEPKTVVQQLAEMTAERDQLKASIDAGQKQIIDLTAQVEALTGERDTAVASVATLTAKVEALDGELTSEKASHAKTAETLDMAKLALKNPAFTDAAHRGLAKGTEEGGVPPSSDDGPKTAAEAHKMHDAIEDPKERAAFRETHKELLGL